MPSMHTDFRLPVYSSLSRKPQIQKPSASPRHLRGSGVGFMRAFVAAVTSVSPAHEDAKLAREMIVDDSLLDSCALVLGGGGGRTDSGGKRNYARATSCPSAAQRVGVASVTCTLRNASAERGADCAVGSSSKSSSMDLRGFSFSISSKLRTSALAISIPPTCMLHATAVAPA